MKLQSRRGSHLPILTKLFNMTTGPILEMGCGLFSTVYLFWACVEKKRRLVTYDDNPKFFEWLQDFKNPKNRVDHSFHEIHLVKDWDSIDLNEKWSIAFIDHSPDSRRAQDIERVSHADYIIVHDAEPKEDLKRAQSGYRTIASVVKNFRYSYLYTEAIPNTLILSNRYSIEDLMTRKVPKVTRIVPETEMIKTHPGQHRRYTICRALREIFVKTNDPEIRLKLQYACTLAEYITAKVDSHDHGWLKDFYPFRREFNTIMSIQSLDNSLIPYVTKENLVSEAYLQECSKIPGRHKKYPICVALGQIYTQTTNPEDKFRLRYAITLAQRITERLETLDPGWLRNFYLSYRDFENLKNETINNS